MALRTLWILLLLFLSAVLAAVPAEAWRTGSVMDRIQTMRIGAGGQLTGIDIQCDQGVGQCNNSGTTTKVTRPDTYGAYKWITSGTCDLGIPAPCWQQLVTFNSLPNGDPATAYGACSQGNFCAAYEIRIAPSNTNIAYMLFNDYLYKTTNLQSSSVTWTVTNWTPSAVYPNENTKFHGPFLAIDPQNPDVVIAGTQSGSAFYTTDGGANFTAVTLGTPCTPATVSGAHGGGYTFAYDPSSSVSGGLKQGIYLTCYGTGVYQSTTGPGGTFTLLNASGMPTLAQQIVVSDAGLLYVTSSNNAYLYTGGAWTVILDGTTKSIATRSIAIDRNNPTNLIAVGGSNNPAAYYSTNSATAPTWGSRITAWSRSSAAVPWLALSSADLGSTSFANVVFDPAQSNTALIADGISVWSVVPNLTGNCGANCYSLTAMAAGIEQLVANDIQAPPGGNPIFLGWDRPVWVSQNPNAYLSNYGMNHNQSINHAWSGDYFGSSVFTLVNWTADNAGYSALGGGDGSPSNWTVFPAQPTPSVISGSIAVVGASNVAISQNSLYGSIYYTTNRGTTFTGLSSCSGVPYPGINVTTGNSLTIGTGTKTLTGIGTGLTYPTSAAVTIYRTANSSNSMTGTVTSYNSGTGELVLNITSVTGSGTFSDWTVYQYTGWGSNIGFHVSRFTLTADKVDGNYYAFNYNFAPGVYRISSDGSTCTRIKDTNFDPSTVDAFAAQLRAVPGVAKHMFFTAGPQVPDNATQKFWHCIDNGGGTTTSLSCSDTSSYVNGVTDVAYFGFGKTKPGDTYPAIYLYGRVAGEAGLWRGTNLSTTPVWTKLSHYAIGGWLDGVKTVQGDMNTYGRVYIGFQGSGWKYGTFNFLLKRDLDPASNDNSPMWLEKAA